MRTTDEFLIITNKIWLPLIILLSFYSYHYLRFALLSRRLTIELFK